MKIEEARSTLRSLYGRNGYVKIKEQTKRSNAGIEARISVNSARARHRLLAALRAVGLEAGRPFVKRKQLRVPVYGRERVASLLQIVGVTDRRVKSRGGRTA